jgi:GxxExxY protein
MNKEYSENGEGDRDPLTRKVIGCAIEVHRHLGPGLLESAYEKCLAQELMLAGVRFEVQVAIPVMYKVARLDCGYRVDMLVDDRLIVELKATEQLLKVHEAQVITYMKLSDCAVGLLINFNVNQLKNGIRRLFSSLYSPFCHVLCQAHDGQTPIALSGGVPRSA